MSASELKLLKELWDTSSYVIETYLVWNKTNWTKTSLAAANILDWAINIMNFNTIFLKCKPLKEKADAAEKEKTEKTIELEEAITKKY